ncbi:nuclear transport factor 2 family protein [Amycolatopsis sp. PS_44_ISF1]|uniref:nuclear transport factor 2 family protein n=1 Tax=Amycolatopsis sp. PS_44_ISF1 TaxID=2974917 RepID=UPI0028E08F39|nr:nuclear transport factor 2 family protein [Amycolatopsis sp. PS_44_ISF1]MDT8913296.1 nuclear transport factor 2 family protein [Amycolatopsis sp. PS_44_ISF1]
MPEAAFEDVLAVHQLYGRQSHAIDSGRAREWAETFTADGEFSSPSYPAPSTGTAGLTAFAERFHAGCLASGETLRHVVGTVDVRPGATPDELSAHAYLQIIGTPADGSPPRTHRLTVIADELRRTAGGWRIRHRVVHRDA